MTYFLCVYYIRATHLQKITEKHVLLFIRAKKRTKTRRALISSVDFKKIISFPKIFMFLFKFSSFVKAYFSKLALRVFTDFFKAKLVLNKMLFSCNWPSD